MKIRIRQTKVICYVKCSISTQLVRTTLIRHRFNVLTSFQRPYNVVLTPRAGWVLDGTKRKGREIHSGNLPQTETVQNEFSLFFLIASVHVTIYFVYLNGRNGKKKNVLLKSSIY